MEFVKVVKSELVREGRGRVAWAGTTIVSIFRIEGEIFVTKNFCPHAGGSLGTGRVRGKIVYCPRHDWGFNVETGACITQKMFSVDTFPVEVRDGYVWVGLG